MGIFDFFKHMSTSQEAAEYMLKLQFKAYDEAIKLYPGANPHILLSHVWVTRRVNYMTAAQMARPQNSGKHDAIIQKSLFETWMFSILPFPQSVKALGLKFIIEERQDIIKKFPMYRIHYDDIVEYLEKLTKNGAFFDAYKEINPQLTYEKSANSETGWLFKMKES